MTQPTTPSACYGLHVSTADLVAAGLALKATAPALAALELITRLRTQGSLATVGTDRSAVVEMPVEAWLLVRRFLVHSALNDARQATLERVGPCDCLACLETAFRAKHAVLLSRLEALEQALSQLEHTVHTKVDLVEGENPRFEAATAEPGMWSAVWVDGEQSDACWGERNEARRDQFAQLGLDALGPLSAHLALSGLRLVAPSLIEPDCAEPTRLSHVTSLVVLSQSGPVDQGSGLRSAQDKPPLDVTARFARFCRELVVQPVDPDTGAPVAKLEPKLHRIG